MVKVVVNNKQYKITIPKDLAESKGWNSDTKLRFVEMLDGTIIIKELEKQPLKNKKEVKNS